MILTLVNVVLHQVFVIHIKMTPLQPAANSIRALGRVQFPRRRKVFSVVPQRP